LDKKEFGEYIRNLRNERGLKIRQVELYSGVSNSYLSLLENGKRDIPSPDILKKLARVYKVSYADLMKKAGYIDYTIDDDESGMLVKETNTKYKTENDIFIRLKRGLVKEGIINESDGIDDETLELILKHGEEAAKEILKARKKQKG